MPKPISKDYLLTQLHNFKDIILDPDYKIQMTELPTAAEDLEGTIYQYIGSDETTYKKGAFYECVSDGESTPTYSWEQKDVQSSGYKSINFLTMTGAKYQCITGLKFGGAYLIEIGYNMFIVRVLNNFGDQSQKKYGFEIELLGQNLSDTTNAFYNYPVYLNNFEDNALKPILAIYVSNGDRTNIRVTQISGVVNDDFDFGTFYTSIPPVPFKKSTFYSAASMREAIAPLFNDNTSYNVGDIVWKRVNTSANSSRVHDNIELYRCIVAHSGSWSSAHFEKIQLCKDFKSGSKVFSGTMDEWDALTEAEKAKYDFIATPDEAVEDIANAIIDGDMRAITSNAVAQVVPSDASSSNKLVSAATLNNRIREVFRIPYNMNITNFLARFASIGIHVGEVFIEGNIDGMAVNSWCSYEANIVSVTNSYVGNIKLTDLNNGTEFLYKSYNTGSFNWVLVTPITGTATPTEQLVSGNIIYAKSGNICTVSIRQIAVNTSESNRLLCTGLPLPVDTAIFFGCVTNDIFYTMNITENGSLRDANNTVFGEKTNIYGSITYICK